MFFDRLFELREKFGNKAKSNKKTRRQRFRPALEALEERTVLDNNDTFATATQLWGISPQNPGLEGAWFFTQDDFGQFQITAGDVDWYRFETRLDGVFGSFARIEFDHSEGDLDLEIYDRFGNFLLRSSGTDDQEAIGLMGAPADV